MFGGTPVLLNIPTTLGTAIWDSTGSWCRIFADDDDDTDGVLYANMGNFNVNSNRFIYQQMSLHLSFKNFRGGYARRCQNVNFGSNLLTWQANIFIYDSLRV